MIPLAGAPANGIDANRAAFGIFTARTCCDIREALSLTILDPPEIDR
jgi:hypothetical protein